MTKTLNVSDVKTRFYELLKGVQEREDEVIVTRDGKPAAVVINYQEFESLMATLEVLSDPKAMERIRKANKNWNNADSWLSHEELFGL